MTKQNHKPAICFKGFHDDWEEKKLGEVSISFDYGLNAASKEFDGKNKYLRITDIDDNSHHCCPTKIWLYSWFGIHFLLKINL